MESFIESIMFPFASTLSSASLTILTLFMLMVIPIMFYFLMGRLLYPNRPPLFDRLLRGLYKCSSIMMMGGVGGGIFTHRSSIQTRRIATDSLISDKSNNEGLPSQHCKPAMRAISNVRKFQERQRRRRKDELVDRMAILAERFVRVKREGPEGGEGWELVVEGEGEGEGEEEEMRDRANIKINDNCQQEDQSELRVWIDPQHPLCFKAQVVLPMTARLAADYLNDWGERRAEWDGLCDLAETLDHPDCDSAIVYYRTRAIWPTPTRDAILLSHQRTFDGGTIAILASSVGVGEEDYHYQHEHEREQDCSFTSTEQEEMDKTQQTTTQPSLTLTQSAVRMEVKLLAHWLVPLQRASKGVQGKCMLTIILDCDPKGYVPLTVSRHLATRTLPLFLLRLRHQLSEESINPSSSLYPAHQQSQQEPSTRNLDQLQLFTSLDRINARLECIEKRLSDLSIPTPSHPITWRLLCWSSFLLVTMGVVQVYLRRTRPFLCHYQQQKD